MKWSFQILRVFGIPIKVHATFLLLLAVVALAGREEPATTVGVSGLLLICLVFLCVVLHELGHSLVARRYGIRIRDIVLLPIGGVARMESMPEKPLHEIAIAVAGPMVSATLAFLFFAVIVASLGAEVFLQRSVVGAPILFHLFLINLMLLLFNLIPAFPLDGGRVLRGLLALKTNWVQGTRIAVKVGQGFALLFFLAGIAFQVWVLPLIALFVYIGGKGEQRAILQRWALRSTPAREAMLTSVQTIAPWDSIGAVAARSAQSAQHDFPVVEAGRIVGMLTHPLLVGALHQLGPESPVSAVMSRQFVTADESDSLESLYRRMTETGQTAVLIVRDGRVVGLVDLQQIGKYHLLHAARPAART